jgi:hypothetical protein
MNKIFRYFEETGVLTMDVIVSASSHEDAVNQLWDYFEHNPNIDRGYMIKKELSEHVSEMTLTIFDATQY